MFSRSFVLTYAIKDWWAKYFSRCVLGVFYLLTGNEFHLWCGLDTYFFFHDFGDLGYIKDFFSFLHGRLRWDKNVFDLLRFVQHKLICSLQISFKLISFNIFAIIIPYYNVTIGKSTSHLFINILYKPWLTPKSIYIICKLVK